LPSPTLAGQEGVAGSGQYLHRHHDARATPLSLPDPGNPQGTNERVQNALGSGVIVKPTARS